MFDGVSKDLRYAFRQLAQSKGFTLTAVLTLALGIGANTAIFTLVDAVMLRSLPVADPERLYRLGDDDNCCVIGGTQSHFSIYAYPLYVYLRDHTPSSSRWRRSRAARPESASAAREAAQPGQRQCHLRTSSFPAITSRCSASVRSPAACLRPPTTGPARRRSQ
jgi:macrolide transport system ATP-binding/permease protein